MEEKKIRLHLVLDAGDTELIQAIQDIKKAEIVQCDYSFDTAYEWTLHNGEERIDVFFGSEFAQVSTTDGTGKTLHRDTALLRRIKELHLMRPQAKFVLICDDDRDRPENRHFLGNLVAIGVYDFVVGTELTEEKLQRMIEEPARDITHVQDYLPENIGDGTPQPFLPARSVKVMQEEKRGFKAVDIFSMIRRSQDTGEGVRKARPKVKHIIEKVRPSVVTFTSFGINDGLTSLLAREYAVKLAARDAEVALVELHNTGIPRMAFETGVMSTVKTLETALQRIEDEEDVWPVLITPEEAAGNIPHYDKAILGKLKGLPRSLHILSGRPNITPNVHPLRVVNGYTLDAAPGEIVNQLIFRHNFDCIVFAVSGALTQKLAFHSIKTSNYIYAITDQHSAHISWLRQNMDVIFKLKIPKKNVRVVIYPYYELPNLRQSDIEAALGVEVDYLLPDVTADLLNSTWGPGSVSSVEFSRSLAEMIYEATGYKLPNLENRRKKRGLFGGVALFSRRNSRNKGREEKKEVSHGTPGN